jgi:hypothetical protein
MTGIRLPLRLFRVILAARVILLACIALAAAGGPGEAAQFRSVEMPNGSGPDGSGPNGSGRGILLSGEIVPGDETVFHALAETLPKAVVITTGPGGTVVTALRIGSEIRARGWSTLVSEGARCASACSLIWLAGQTRMLGAGAQIGFHAVSMLQNGQRTETHELDSVLRTWLTDMGYALDATATIVNTQAASIRWYNTTELLANGILTDPYP